MTPECRAGPCGRLRERAGRGATFVALIALAACKPPPVHVPGAIHDVNVLFKLAAIPQAERNAIGSFTMTVTHDGEDVATVPLNFNAANGDITLIGDAPALPTTGTLSFRVQGNDIAGNAIDVGGASNAVSLDATPAGAVAQAFAVVARLDAPTPLDEELRAGGPAIAARAGTGVLVHGARNEWIDLATGEHCDDVTADCDFGDAPTPGRSGGVAVSLDAFDASCEHAGKVVVGLGRIGDAVFNDLYLFDPSALSDAADDGAFSRLDVTVAPRTGGTAVATRDCRVILAGGAGSSGAPENNVEIVVVDAAPRRIVGGSLPAGLGAGAVAIATRNALDEIVVAGGGDPAVTDGALLTPSGGGETVTICALGDGDCNGDEAALACARAGAAVARIDDGTDDATHLVVGGTAAADCEAELFQSSADAPFASFRLVTGTRPVVRVGGHAAAAFGAGRAVVVGGFDGNAIVGAVDVFTGVRAGDGSIDDGGFSSLPPLATSRAQHAAVEVGGAVLIVGGEASGNAPVSSLEVLVPAHQVQP